MILFIGILFILISLILFNEYNWEVKMQELNKISNRTETTAGNCTQSSIIFTEIKTNKRKSKKKKSIKNKKRKK